MDVRAKILWWAAKRRVKLDKPIVIAVGGGIAKTSTKVALGAVLEQAYPGNVLVGYGNLNTFLGVPLAILGFRIDFHQQQLGLGWVVILIQAMWRSLTARLPKYLVLEYGTDHPRDIKELVGQLKPNMAVLTVVAAAHLAHYPSLEELAQDEGTLVEAVGKSGQVFLNHDDPFLKMHQQRCQATQHIVVTKPEKMAQSFAAAVGQSLGLSKAVIEKGLANYQPPAGRLVKKKIGNWQVVDDSYNANPASMHSAFQVISDLPGRKVAILGSMLELGPGEVEFHQHVGQEAVRAVDIIIGVGDLAKNYQSDYWFKDADTAADHVLAHLKDGDTILIKGSRGIHMEKIVQALETYAHTRY